MTSNAEFSYLSRHKKISLDCVQGFNNELIIKVCLFQGKTKPLKGVLYISACTKMENVKLTETFFFFSFYVLSHHNKQTQTFLYRKWLPLVTSGHVIQQNRSTLIASF